MAAAVALLLASRLYAQSQADRRFFNAGIVAFRNDLYAEAVKNFRAARFMSLEDPALYEEALACLAVAEDAAGQADASDATLGRFLKAEMRFGAFAVSSLEPPFDTRFRELALKRFTRETILGIPTLAAELGLIDQRPTRPPTSTPVETAETAATPTPAPVRATATTEVGSPVPTSAPMEARLPTATEIPQATATASATATPPATSTPAVTATSVPPVTPTATHTNPPTATPTHPPTLTPTAIPSMTASPRPTATATAVPSATRTATPTYPPTATPTVVPSATASPRPTATATAVPSATRTATTTPSFTPTPIPPTATASPTRTSTFSPSPTRSSTFSPSATRTATATPVPVTPTRTLTPSRTPTPPPVPFVPPAQVDVPPRPIHVVMPVYPERALKDRVRGLVILRVTVSETGVPTDVSVQKPGREGLTEAAVQAAKQWRFEPGRKGGRAVRTYATVQFPFEGVQFARTPLDLNATPGPVATPTPSP